MSHVKKRTGIIWNYYKPIAETGYAKCSFCAARISYKSTVSNLKNHLQKRHPTMYSKIFKQINNSEVITKTNDIYDRDPIFTEPGKKRRSILWNYYKPIAETNYAKCTFCAARISYKSTISNLKGHLQSRHPTMYLKIFKKIKSDVITKTKDIDDSDPLFFTEPISPEPEKSNKGNAPTRRSSLHGSSNTNVRKPLERPYQEEHETLSTTEVIQDEPRIRRVYQPRFALSWDSYQSRLCSNLNTLLQNEDFVDLTLAAGGHLVKVHQLIMSIASPYLKEIIHSSPARHPIIFLTNVSYPTLRHLLQYVYTGQVDITEEELEPFFAAAKALQIQGIDTEIDTNILRSKAGDQIGEEAKLPPDPIEVAVEEVNPDCDDFDESQNLIMPRSATARRSNAPDTERILSKRQPVNFTPQTLAEELEPGDLGDVMMDEDMVILASSDMTDGVDPIEFYEVSRTDDPDPMKSPKSPKIVASPDMTDGVDPIELYEVSRTDDPDPMKSRKSSKSPPSKNMDTVTVQTMLLNHYKYTLASTSEGGVRKWRCVDYLKHGCRARTVTNGNTVVERSRSHNHPFHDQK